MATKPGASSVSAESSRAILVQRTIRAGWVSVVLSASFLYLSLVLGPGRAGSDPLVWSFALMAARLFGIASFAIGGIAVYNHRWTEGVFLLLLSVGLPLVSFVVHGTI